jgi:hypothetical protein
VLLSFQASFLFFREMRERWLVAFSKNSYKVSRLGELSHIGQLFTLGKLFFTLQNKLFSKAFSPIKLDVFISTILSEFFSQTHPVTLLSGYIMLSPKPKTS